MRNSTRLLPLCLTLFVAGCGKAPPDDAEDGNDTAGAGANGGSGNVGGTAAEGGSNGSVTGGASTNGGSEDSGGRANGGSGGRANGGSSDSAGTGTNGGSGASANGGSGGLAGTGGSANGGSGGAAGNGASGGLGGRPGTCTPDARFCAGNEVRRCGGNGESSSLVQTCDSAQFCDRDTAACLARLCVPGEPACDESVLTTCNAAGSGYEGNRVDCAASQQFCVQGECSNQACDAGRLFCEANEFRQCDPDGLGSFLIRPCGSDAYCDAHYGGCFGQLCTPNQPACNGGVITTCNGDGSGYLAPISDCALTGQACAAGACIACGPIFTEDFSSGAGWTLEPEWEIGPAMASSPGNGYGDPATDHTDTADNRLAGVVIGGNAADTNHPLYYLTSPVIPTPRGVDTYLLFWRWLNSDVSVGQNHTVEVFDGNTWVLLSQSTTASPTPRDSAWTQVGLLLTEYANPNLRIRFGHQVFNTYYYEPASSWNIDDVTVNVRCPF